MKKLLKLFIVSCLLSIVMLLSSCGERHESFLLQGTFKGFNQGELYIYGVDGTWPLDTIGVARGEFRYSVAITEPTTFVLVFPNFTELPVHGTQGGEVTIKGDASHLREAKITGSAENEQMTAFRQKTSGATPPEVATATAQFVKENPASPFASYLVTKTFLLSPQPDYRQAAELLGTIQQATGQKQGDLIRRMKGLAALKDGSRLPTFTATDLQGRTVTAADLNARVNVITVWSSWNYESINIQRMLLERYNRHPGDIKVLSVCLDADVKECRRRVTRDSVRWHTVCDGRVWDNAVLHATGLAHVPDNSITDASGKILAHGLNNRELLIKIDALLPDKTKE